MGQTKSKHNLTSKAPIKNTNNTKGKEMDDEILIQSELSAELAKILDYFYNSLNTSPAKAKSQYLCNKYHISLIVNGFIRNIFGNNCTSSIPKDIKELICSQIFISTVIERLGETLQMSLKLKLELRTIRRQDEQLLNLISNSLCQWHNKNHIYFSMNKTYSNSNEIDFVTATKNDEIIRAALSKIADLEHATDDDGSYNVPNVSICNSDGSEQFNCQIRTIWSNEKHYMAIVDCYGCSGMYRDYTFEFIINICNFEYFWNNKKTVKINRNNCNLENKACIPTFVAVTSTVTKRPKYAAERVIGGSHGVVYKAVNIETRREVEIKKVRDNRRYKV